MLFKASFLLLPRNIVLLLQTFYSILFLDILIKTCLIQECCQTYEGGLSRLMAFLSAGSSHKMDCHIPRANNWGPARQYFWWKVRTGERLTPAKCALMVLHYGWRWCAERLIGVTSQAKPPALFCQSIGERIAWPIISIWQRREGPAKWIK